MNIAIITTVDHNVGDDFVREGIKYLLRQYFKDKTLEFQNIHKHSPITSRHGFEWFRSYRFSKRVDKLIPIRMTKDRILEADLVVQSGAPVYWCHDGGPHCSQNEWFEPLIRKRFQLNKNGKLLNLAGGTCQRYFSKGDEFCDSCHKYIKEFYSLSKITTLRDNLANVVLNNVGLDAPVIPCASIFAIDEYDIKNSGEDYVVVNYMQGGAHFTFGQNINFEKWEKEFKDFYSKLKKNENIIFACHNEKEVEEAKRIDPDAKIFYEKNDYLKYMKFYSKAKFGIMNRVHGAYIMASFGKPSIIIGNDSRARMAENIGLKSYFVNDVDSDLLGKEYEYLNSGAENFNERLKEIKEKAYTDYLEALSVL